MGRAATEARPATDARPATGSQSMADYAEHEARYGIVPLLHTQRMYSLIDLAFVAGMFAVATWCYVQGARIADIMTMPQGIASTFGSVLAFIAVISLVGTFTARYGLDHWICQRANWGYYGVMALLAVALPSAYGWDAINAQIFGSSVVKLMGSLGVDVPGRWWLKGISILCPLLGLAIAMKGPGAVRIATRIMGLMLLAVGALIVIIMLASGDLTDAWGAPPLSGASADWTTYMLGNEWNIAFALSWFTVIGSVARLSRTERGAHWGLWLGYGLLMACFVVIGVALAHVAGVKGAGPTGDPTDYMLDVGGPWLGSLTLVLVGVANITTSAVGLYATSLSTKVIWPSWRYGYVATFWALYIVAMILWGGIWEYYDVFLAVIGVINGPGVALLLADYYVVRRQKYNLRDLFRRGAYRYTGGFNLVAVAAFGTGVAAFFLVYDPLAGAPRVGAIFDIFTASGFSMIVTAGVYIMLAAVPPVRRYLLRDRADGQTVR
jgi:NCS1 family nucleobase:cation symporter-1